MTLDLDHLKQVAQNATQGPWEINSATCGSEYGDYTIYGVKDVADADWATDDVPAFAYCEGMTKPDATYIAAFDPPTVQALIARIEKLEAEKAAAWHIASTSILTGQSAQEIIRAVSVMSDQKATVQRVRDLHRRAHAVFSWQSGTRYEDPCPDCDGAPGVHECGCWADQQIEYVCAECHRLGSKSSGVYDYTWPCPTVQAIEGDPNACLHARP